MANVKTSPTKADVTQFLSQIDDDQRRADSQALAAIMSDITGETPCLWGPSIIGYGSYHYRYASGREGDWMAVGFSPRKQALTLYIMAGFSDYDELLKKLGPHKTGKSCLYVKKLDDVHLPTLKRLIRTSYRYIRDKYPPASP